MESVIQVNERTKKRMVDKIRAVAGDLEGKTVALLGLSFKPETDDIRESPALTLIEGLRQLGARIRAYDPAAMEATRAIEPDLFYAADTYDALDDADVAIIVTEWNQFRALDLEQVKRRMKSPVLIDLRNVYQPEEMAAAGFVYESVGRPQEARS